MPRERRDEPIYRIGKVAGRQYWHILWSEPGSRRTRKISLGTEDEAEAQEEFRRWLAERKLPARANMSPPVAGGDPTP